MKCVGRAVREDPSGPHIVHAEARESAEVAETDGVTLFGADDHVSE